MVETQDRDILVKTAGEEIITITARESPSQQSSFVLEEEIALAMDDLVTSQESLKSELSDEDDRKAMLQYELRTSPPCSKLQAKFVDAEPGSDELVVVEEG